jgi:hypothetical protein
MLFDFQTTHQTFKQYFENILKPSKTTLIETKTELKTKLLHQIKNNRKRKHLKQKTQTQIRSGVHDTNARPLCNTRHHPEAHDNVHAIEPSPVSDANGGPSGCLTVCYGKCSMY